jgi:hypothetical protein
MQGKPQVSGVLRILSQTALNGLLATQHVIQATRQNVV